MGSGTASGPARAMQRLGLVHDLDLVLHLPLRYEDETRLTPLGRAPSGVPVLVQGCVADNRIETRGGRSRRQLLLRLRDGAAELTLRFLHFYPAQQRQWALGQWLRVRGEIRPGLFGPEMVHPAVRVVEPDAPLATTLTPVYPTTAGLPQAYLRKAVASALARTPLPELLPPASLPPALPTLHEAVHLLHAPPARTPMAALQDRSHPAWLRLKFDELLAQQLSQQLAREARERLHAPSLPSPAGEGLAQALRRALPFELTPAQQRVVAEIDADLERSRPMNRLLQGDVGAGKTVVAALAAATVLDAGWQCALMAPTEILAEQHMRKLVQWLEPLGVHTAWLTGSRRGKARREALAAVADGRAGLVVGTQAVIQDDVRFHRLALAIVDEQHRFGVAQRLALRRKLADVALPSHEPQAAGTAIEPHLLMMSATPIPRTLAMACFGDLDVSTIDTLPPGRTPIVTKLFSMQRRDEVVARIRDEMGAGKQAYWVCPLVEESETLDLRNATETHAQLAAALPATQVGLLHGRMAAADKAATMQAFADGRTGLLVATTVIEVGVDVPNASLMVIEHAERFGLAQLHQLRGRVGRGDVASVCVLLYGHELSDTGKARLRAMTETSDGFEIARRDLHIRGPGEFLGARQSGEALLRFADLASDQALLDQAREAATKLLREDPAAARAHVDRWLGSRAEYLKA